MRAYYELCWPSFYYTLTSVVYSFAFVSHSCVLSRTKQADLFSVCSRSTDISVADLQIVYRSSTDYLQIICRMPAEYLQNICRISAKCLQTFICTTWVQLQTFCRRCGIWLTAEQMISRWTADEKQTNSTNRILFILKQYKKSVFIQQLMCWQLLRWQLEFKLFY